MTDSVIFTEDLTKIYQGELGQKPTVGVEGLHLDVRPGEVFAFLGPNGAGKTSTLKLLTRLLMPTRGRALIFGEPVSDNRTMRRVGFVPEQPNLYGYLTAAEMLDFIAKIFGLPASVRKKRISDTLDRVGLAASGGLAVRTFSRGMMQRLGMAQALINDPDLLILDEPMSALDPIGRKDFRDLILDLKNRGKTLFFSSHILSDAELVADRCGILNRGRLVQTGILGDLLESQTGSIEIAFIPAGGRPSAEDLARFSFSEQGGNRVVRVTRPEDVTAVVAAVQAHGGRLVSVSPQRKSLEDVFMAEIGR
ncbi:ABC transporter ATP-binding protein [bacterium]|nr:ABC transporter ATP-binding protein [bacterium]